MATLPKIADLQGQKQYRIIPSVLPSVNFFEDLVSSEEMQILWEIESMTNERLRQEAGDLFLVPSEDRVSGPGASVIMAAFTHLGKPSRFTDGSFGVYYASFSQETAIRETVYHREHFLRATLEEACEITMRLYEGQVIQPLHDIRDDDFQNCHHPYDYTHSQQLARELREANAWGLVYNSVRHDNGHCIAVFRPPAVSIPQQISHLKYMWDGDKIIDVLATKVLLHL